MAVRAGLVLLGVAVCGIAVATQGRPGAFGASRDHAAIRYSDGPLDNAVTALNERIRQGQVRLAFDPDSGYLRSILDALAVPIESQALVYSETSFQARRINRKNPRALYFNDHVAVGWVRGGEVLEIAAHDRRQGTVFYTLPQKETAGAELTRNDKCLACHLSWETLAVPGPIVLSVLPRRSDDEYANGSRVDHRTPLPERWGGWFVTGARVPADQLGNLELIQPKLPASGPKPIPAKASVEGEFDLRGYRSAFSDIAALMVLEHQVHAVNLITRAGWEFRQAVHENPSVAAQGAPLPARVLEAVDELVDYLLFVDEAPLATPVRGSSGFDVAFARQGPKDKQGRSLRELQLDTRLMRYPCSFMIYSPGFQGLPDAVKSAVVGRISAILSGADAGRKYAHLTSSDRRAIAAILADTLPGFTSH